MKKKKSAYIISIAFLCIIAAFFVSVCVRVYQTQVKGDYGDSADSSEAAESTYTAAYDWSGDYPFAAEPNSENAQTAQEAEPEAAEQEGFLARYTSAVKTIEDKIDYYTTKLLPGRMKFVEANAFFNKAVGMKIVSGTDSVVAMTNGYLTFETNEIDTADAAKSLADFSEILSKKGIDFTYIQYPAKEQKGNDKLPSGLTDFANKNADSLLERLDEYNVKYTDMRSLLEKKDDNWYSNFFLTDHHWKPETGVWAAGEIAEMLNNDFGYGINSAIGDIEAYTVDVYEKYCLGSQGRIATLTYADPEDISLIYPKNETDFTVRYNTDEAKTGKFEDVFFDKTNLSNTDYYNHSAYAAYLYGNKALTSIKNNNCKNGKKILVIGDSFNKSVVPYLAQSVESVDLLDRRYFNGSVLDYIEKTSPDVVLVAYTPTLIGDASTHSSTFNFE